MFFVLCLRTVLHGVQEVVLQSKMLGLANGGPGAPDSAAGFLSQVNEDLCIISYTHIYNVRVPHSPPCRNCLSGNSTVPFVVDVFLCALRRHY